MTAKRSDIAGADALIPDTRFPIPFSALESE
jgi:hypothetical protein